MTANPQRICVECARRADFIVEPVGRYDCMGWPDEPACAEHLGVVVQNYVSNDMPRVQVRFWDVPNLAPTECCNEGCDTLVADGDPLCLNCERDLHDAIFGAAS